ncbi:Protein-methionine-sulfoxide reductase heme-binding subunit MsrQ [Candidatus Methylobacter favarea]|uniref:Protein-methionine-sulfoxide reductase heme-binding subunit MsrQ n=1 Tax=Candidatus Methylobacter favarea TaxID=2707345 RepID=A0A8S0X9D2_9GAMM|nr:protein-methionine-sulfoxide reductase heme-binding subunit MsrQ [Candidatus Methylobacter favarea]CAA9892136.1 Protein-methionine-sulfoxide reductase heme-binding subunit MsrQ [Candidatus Methylobacter favarea]
MTLKTLDASFVEGIKTGVFLLALAPLIKLGIGFYIDALGANPIEKITRTTGYWTLTFLLITLSITPVRRLLGWNWLIRLRRMLGLFAFFYGSLHFLTYLVLDQFFDWPAIVKDIVKRPYITVGFPSFILMIPLAITSTDRMISRLGGKRWRWLHRLVYLSAVGGVVHYWWLVKKDITNPATFALLLGILLGIRLIYRARGLIKVRLGPKTVSS